MIILKVDMNLRYSTPIQVMEPQNHFLFHQILLMILLHGKTYKLMPYQRCFLQKSVRISILWKK